MPKKAVAESRKTTKAKTSKSASSKSAVKLKRAADSSGQKKSSKVPVERSAATGKFISAKTGRTVKVSPAKPRLGKERIKSAVKSYVHRDTRTKASLIREVQWMPKPTSSYDDNVFINCPFDKPYKPIFNAIVFAIHDAGFVARCGLEVIDSGQTRLTKLISIIKECKYGIHDISRTEVGGKTKLPRFNMPFECGLFWGCFEYGGRKHKDKRTLVLDKEEYRYRASLSDIAGQDIQIHENDPRLAMDKVRSWLNVGSGRTTIPGGKAIWDHYVLFQKELTPMLKRVGITRTELDAPEYYPDYVNFVVEWLIEREAKARG